MPCCTCVSTDSVILLHHAYKTQTLIIKHSQTFGSLSADVVNFCKIVLFQGIIFEASFLYVFVHSLRRSGFSYISTTV